MTWLNNFKIRTKLIIGFFVLVIFTAVVGTFGVINSKEMYDSGKNIYYNNFLPVKDLKDIQTNLERVRTLHVYLLYDRQADKYEEREDSVEAFVAKIDQLLANYEKTIQSEEERTLFVTAAASIDEYAIARNENIDLIAQGKYEDAVAVIQKVVDTRTKADADLQTLVDYNVQLTAEEIATDQKKYDSNNISMLIIISIAIIVAISFGIIIAGSISKPVNKMVVVANKLALGDVNVSINVDSKDEIGMLAKSFEKMIENIRKQAQAAERIATGDLTVEVEVRSENDLLGKKLTELVDNTNNVLTNIVAASDQVAAGAKQVADSSMALSQGATEQAAAVEELTASLEEIATQTDLNAKNASMANELAESAKVNAVQGNGQMKGMLSAMEEINESSTNISKVIKVIDDIAFQTNILALNAAVEAARAGQHGKGFAVVAEEVRNLAARSANAAKETTDMIEGSIKKAESGTKIAKDTAEALDKIVNGVQKVASLVNDIANASNEQAMGISQINQGLMQVSQVVQTNSATSQESAAASEQMASQATILKDSVNRFKIKKNGNSFSKYSEVSPEVMMMLENMSRSTKHEEDKIDTQDRESRSRISLSDNEFGKY